MHSVGYFERRERPDVMNVVTSCADSEVHQ